MSDALKTSTLTQIIEVRSTEGFYPGGYLSFWGVHGPEESYKIIEVLDDTRFLCSTTPMFVPPPFRPWQKPTPYVEVAS
jgi:hypothetical protein